MEPGVRAMRPMSVTSPGVGLRTSTLGALSLIVLTSCVGGQTQVVASRTSHAAARSFSLYTHCGIDELRVDGKFYERAGGPLDDGSGNPPTGWDNPYQAGRITVVRSLVVFTDDRGHKEQFEPRKGATDFKHVCS
jgi:hypothetical protein